MISVTLLHSHYAKVTNKHFDNDAIVTVATIVAANSNVIANQRTTPTAVN
jgi:hypothetical protein